MNFVEHFRMDEWLSLTSIATRSFTLMVTFLPILIILCTKKKPQENENLAYVPSPAHYKPGHLPQFVVSCQHHYIVRLPFYSHQLRVTRLPRTVTNSILFNFIFSYLRCKWHQAELAFIKIFQKKLSIVCIFAPRHHNERLLSTGK